MAKTNQAFNSKQKSQPDGNYMLLSEYSAKGELLKGFNSTASRFKTGKRRDVETFNEPGPDAYDCFTHSKATLKNVTKKVHSNANPSKGAQPAFMDKSRRELFELELKVANQKP